jgi:hypothetical protein
MPTGGFASFVFFLGALSLSLFFRDSVAVRWDLKFKIPLLGWPSLVFLKVTVRFLNISGVD